MIIQFVLPRGEDAPLAVSTNLPPCRNNITESFGRDLHLFSEHVHDLEVPFMQNPIRLQGHSLRNVSVPSCGVPGRL